MTTEPTQTELMPAQEKMLAPTRTLSLESAYQAVVDGNLDAEKLSVLKDLLALNAARQFNEAFNALQTEMPILVATTIIPNRGKYLKYEDMWKHVGPLLTKHGFSVSYSNSYVENRIIEICHLSHIGGHTRSNSFAVRLGGRADSETQADCKAATTAKRNALCNAINATIQQDCLTSEDDAAIEGGPVTKEQAEELERRVALTNSNVAAFLKFAGAKTFAEIPSGRYQVLDAFLEKKERRGK